MPLARGQGEGGAEERGRERRAGHRRGERGVRAVGREEVRREDAAAEQPTAIKSDIPMHGKLSKIKHNNTNIFEGIDQDFLATRYHSLVVDKQSLPESLIVTAETKDGLIMGFNHVERPVFGVQFHPESIATDFGYKILANFLRIAGLKDHSVEKINILQGELRKNAK